MYANTVVYLFSIGTVESPRFWFVIAKLFILKIQTILGEDAIPSPPPPPLEDLAKEGLTMI